MSTKEVGDDLEARVSAYYEALGYKVTKDVNILGHQIDLVAKRYIPGAANITVIVEVKSRSSTLGINDVSNFIFSAKHLIGSLAANSAVLVTDAKISQDARSAVHDLDSISIIKISDLEGDIFTNYAALIRVQRDCESERIYKSYYPLYVRTQYDDLQEAVQCIRQWYSENDGIFILTGDFGTGKTTVVDRVFYEAVVDRLRSAEKLFPIILRLRNLRQYNEIWHFIEASLRDSQYIQPSRNVFYGELERGRLLIILDGFDEIHTGATPEDKAQFLAVLAPLLRSKSPCILTTRPTFFDSQSQMLLSVREVMEQRAPNFDRLPTIGVNQTKLAIVLQGKRQKPLRERDLQSVASLQQLGADQVKTAISCRSEEIFAAIGADVELFLSYLYGIYDLRDLMQRPLLLDMILETVISGAIDIRSRQRVGPATLYEVYTQGAALRDKNKGAKGQFLSQEERLSACRAIAIAMSKKGEVLLTDAEVSTAIRENFAKNSHINIDDDLQSVVTDVRTCSFLRFSDDGSLTFTHRSYSEFFLAQKIFLSVSVNPNPFLAFSSWKISREVCYFLGGYARDQDIFYSFMNKILTQKLNQRQKNFVYRVVIASGTLLSKCSLIGGEISDVDTSKVSVPFAYMREVSLRKCTFRDVEATRWQMEDVVLEEVLFEECRFIDSSLRVSGKSIDLYSVKIQGTGLTARVSHMMFDGAEVMDSTLKISGMVNFVDSRIYDAQIELFDGGRLTLHGSTSIVSSTVIARTLGKWYSGTNKSLLKDSLLQGLVFDAGHIFGDPDLQTKPGFRITGCRGFIVINGITKGRDKSHFRRLKADNPDLVIVDSRYFARGNWDEAQDNFDVGHAETIAELVGMLNRHQIDRDALSVSLGPFLSIIETDLPASKIRRRRRNREVEGK